MFIFIYFCTNPYLLIKTLLLLIFPLLIYWYVYEKLHFIIGILNIIKTYISLNHKDDVKWKNIYTSYYNKSIKIINTPIIFIQ